ncbi:MAG: putative porin [Alistipes sp.]|nr:putative porin [Alistipes sp.]
MRKPLLILVALLAVVLLPEVSSAQIDAAALARAQRGGQNNGMMGVGGIGGMAGGVDMYGNPLPEGENMEEPVDSTDVKKKRERRPLESYYFDDETRALPNWKWSVDRDYNRVNISPLDTTLADWRLDYVFYRRGVGDMALGGLGQSTQATNWFDRRQGEDFTFARSYDAYTARMENVPFYNGKKPLTNLLYLESGQKRYREEHFEIVHSQNITPSTSVNVNYKARSTMGKYDWQRTKNRALSVAAAHTGKRYSVHAAYMHNNISTRENGGVVGEWAIADTVFEMPSGVPMRLASSEAENHYRNHAFFVKQAFAIPLQRVTEYDFSLANIPAVYVGHQIEYNSWSKVYTDKRATFTNERGEVTADGKYKPTTDSYYDDWFISPQTTRDSISERLLSNKIFVQVQPWDRNGVVSTIDGGIGLDLHTYSYLRLEDYLSGKMTKDKRTSWYIYGATGGKIKRYVDWGADVKYHPSGYRGGDLSIGADVTFRAFIREHPLILRGSFRQELRSPGYWQENLFSNHYAWFNSFGKESETRFEVNFSVPDFALEVGAWQGVIGNMIYYDNDSRVAQHSGTISLTSLYARKDFRIAGLHLDHRALVQFTSNESVLPVPIFSAFLSYYYEFWVKRDVLRVQIGIDGRFNTSYYAPSYNPALSVFFNQREVKVGNYPYLDLFLSAKWKRMRILLKLQHLNQNLFGNGEYFQVARYPLNPRMFKFGISWSFYD